MRLCLWAVLQENIEKSMDCKLRRNPDTGAHGCESRIDLDFTLMALVSLISVRSKSTWVPYSITRLPLMLM